MNINDSNIRPELTFRRLVLLHMQQLTNFPYIEEDFDALTDYELLSLVVKYLNDVITNSNEQNTSITNLYNAFLQLQTYMNNSVQELEDEWNAKTTELEEDWDDKTTELETAFNNLQTWINNYFDNLDVQDEINNKLDQMLEDGVLEQIIEQFLQLTSLICFDNVADMKNSSNITNGSYAKTLGFHSKNDGGEALYKIRTITNDDVVDEMFIIQLNDSQNQLIAELIYDNVNIKQLGAYGDGTHNDITIIQHAIDNSPHKTIFIPKGNYLIKNYPITIKSGNEYQVNLKLDDNAKIFTNESLESLISVGADTSTWNRYTEGSNVVIDGGIFDCTNVNYGIYLNSNRKQTTVKNITMYNVANYGIYCDTGTSGGTSTDARIYNVTINGIGSDISGTGIYLNAPDNELNEIRVNKTKVGINDNVGGNIIDNIHLLGSYSVETPTTANYEQTTGIIFGGGQGYSMLSNIYIDTFAKNIVFNTTRKVNITNLYVMYWYSDENATTKLFEINCDRGLNLFVTNAKILMPEVGTRKGLDLSGSNKDFRQYIAGYDSIKFSDFIIWFVSSPIDPIFTRGLYKENYINLSNPWKITMTANKYYPIAYLKAGLFNLNIRMGNDQIINAIIENWSASVSNITITNIKSNSHQNEYSLALCNGSTDSDNIYGAYLCIVTTGNNCGYNPAITSGLHDWTSNVISYKDFSDNTPFDNPTVHASASFN